MKSRGFLESVGRPNINDSRRAGARHARNGISAVDPLAAHLFKPMLFSLIGVVAVVAFCMDWAGPGYAQQTGLTHTPLLKRVLPDTASQEVTVWETEYPSGAHNRLHMHPAAITFYVLSGIGIWQEDGKPPVTLHAGESLFVPAGTVHSHWNPSATERLRFLEFMVAEKDKGRSIPRP
jgi:quercetin dioxygenase-like cupin family protein